jgi:16S rRNA (cytosine967-C5)-methyltransferase
MSVYQLKYMDQVPDSAVCNEAVKLAKKRGFKNLTGFVNGVLRSIAREMDQIAYPDPKKYPIQSLSVRYSMPEWLVKRWITEYGTEATEKILESFLKISKTTIRVHKSNGTIEDLKASFMQEHVMVSDGEFMEEALKISGYDYLESLTSFEEGKFQVQDESSMLVGRLADPKEGMLVVDVCSAPGGKSLHVAELLHGTGKVISRDLTDYKADLILQNKERLDCSNVEVQVHDALELDPELIGKADIVIADLPCSGLGIIGKKHDIKYNITEEQMKELAQLQKQILSVVVQYMKPDGIFMYSTCTINPDENQRNVQWMIENLDLETVAFDELMPKRLQIETAKEGYIQLLPGIHPCDGFFIAKLKKRA